MWKAIDLFSTGRKYFAKNNLEFLLYRERFDNFPYIQAVYRLLADVQEWAK
jgi:hypothetical protein